MKKNVFCFIFFLSITPLGLYSQAPVKSDVLEKYGRSSLYVVLASHPSQKYGAQIDSVFTSLPFPDKYENHNLKNRKITCSAKEKKLKSSTVEMFVDTAKIAQGLVAKWFNRNPTTGTFDLSLISQRGNYNASKLDVKEALLNKRGLSILSDAGEELIKNTFLIVNDIIYVDKEKNAAIASAILGALAVVSSVAAVVTASSGNSSGAATSSIIASTAVLGAAISDLISGFTVKVRSDLYRLDWNDSVAAVFYNDFWCDTSYSKEEIAKRKALFDTNPNLFSLQYIGSYKVKSAKTVLKGLHDNGSVIKKVCTRALDKNIASLQKKYDVFKVKTPVFSSDGTLVYSQVGLKEGLSSGSKFEVLERKEDEQGATSYDRVAILKPVGGRIWDNRFMATEEEAESADLNATAFKKISGGNVTEGMLIRQLK